MDPSEITGAVSRTKVPDTKKKKKIPLSQRYGNGFLSEA